MVPFSSALSSPFLWLLLWNHHLFSAPQYIGSHGNSGVSECQLWWPLFRTCASSKLQWGHLGFLCGHGTMVLLRSPMDCIFVTPLPLGWFLKIV
jgi:hypothetical protein